MKSNANGIDIETYAMAVSKSKKYNDYCGQVLDDSDSILMSLEEYRNGGKNLIGVPVTITPDGNEPSEAEETFND